MRRVSIFGKSIPLFIIILLGVGFASAALMTYISNTVVADVTVDSPIELKIGNAWDNLSLGTLHLGNIVGGESVEFYVSTENKANVETTGTMWNVVSNPAGVTCADFQKLEARVLDGTGTEIYDFADILCVPMDPVDSNAVRMKTTPSEPWHWAALHYDIAHIRVTFKSAAYGTYTVTTQVIPVP